MRATISTPLVLGSGSPRRKEILESLGIPHVVLQPDVDETPRPGEAPDAYLRRIVLAKLEAVTRRVDGEPTLRAAGVLAADTSVICEGDILGKPVDLADARRMVARLAGRAHEVHTRFAVKAAGIAGAPHAETVITRVYFRSLEPGEIDGYSDSGEGMDKAGAYAVQGRGAGLVSRIEGSYTNVVGLPACEVVVALRRLGLA